MYRSPTSHFAQTRHHQTSVYASARFLFETGERNGAPISSRRSCGRRSCSTALSPRSYARPLNINKRRHGVLDSPLCRSANKACALLIGPGPAVNPIDLHTQSTARRVWPPAPSSLFSLARYPPRCFPSRQPRRSFRHRFLLAWAVRAAYCEAVFRKRVNAMERSYGPAIGKEPTWTKDGIRTPSTDPRISVH